MAELEHSNGEVELPLVEAAARLGLTTDALRARIRRGRARGFRRNGRIYVTLPPEYSGPAEDVRTMSGQSSPAEPRPLDREELDRLREDNDRLNRRLDDLLRLQEREQVLRQQMQAFLEKIGDRIALPGESPQQHDPAIQRRMDQYETDLEALKSAITELVRYLGKRDP